MTLLSTLKILTRNQIIQNLKKIPVRNSGHDHNMHIQPSRFIWAQFKDYLHFYFWLAAGPLILITAYANIVIGDAELAEIPEGYTPHHWEYFKHPVTRFIAKHIVMDPALNYESSVSKMAEDSELMLMNQLKKKLKLMMGEKADNKSWFYVPVDPNSSKWTIDRYREFPFKHGGLKDVGEISD